MTKAYALRRNAKSARIVLSGCEVILTGDAIGSGIPRRQGFAWPENARDYAEQLSRERGWPIEEQERAAGGRA